jgi:hypothetical protein
MESRPNEGAVKHFPICEYEMKQRHHPARQLRVLDLFAVYFAQVEIVRVDEELMECEEESPTGVKGAALRLNVLLRERLHTDAKKKVQKRTHWFEA